MVKEEFILKSLKSGFWVEDFNFPPILLSEFKTKQEKVQLFCYISKVKEGDRISNLDFTFWRTYINAKTNDIKRLNVIDVDLNPKILKFLIKKCELSL